MPVIRSSPHVARVGISLQFFTNGVLLSTLLPRYPEVKAAFGLDDATFGIVVVALAAGSIVVAGAAAPLIRRFGALRVASLGSVGLACAVAAAGWSPSVLLFAGALALVGVVDAVVDSAQNVHALVVETWHGRSIINSLHALWSLGAAAGGLVGTLAGAAGVPLGIHLTANGVVGAGVALLAGRLARAPELAVQDDHPADAPPGRHAPWLRLAPLVALAISGTLVEDVANNWATLFLHRETGATLSLAGLGFVAALASQFIGRLLGDPMTDRWGRDAVAAAGGACVATGAALVALGSFPVAVAGFALAGFGCATLVPAAFAAAGRLPGFAAGTAVTMLSWLMRLGFLLTSPLMGQVSTHLGLRAAMVLPLGAGLVAATISLRRRSGRAGRRMTSWDSHPRTSDPVSAASEEI